MQNNPLKKAITDERQHIINTLDLLEKEILSLEIIRKSDCAAASTFLQNIYMGMENIIRMIIESKGIRIPKTGSYHKDIILKAVETGIISEQLYAAIYEHLQFRHRHMHGYGYMLNWEKVKPLADNSKDTVDKFFTELIDKGYL